MKNSKVIKVDSIEIEFDNSYYSDQLDLILSGKDFYKKYDISECQDITD